MVPRKVHVVVVGAGVAGLAAAERLLDGGCRVTVVEARRRIGGRVDTRRDFAASPIERGAEFVHGCHPDLLARIDQAGLSLATREFDPLMLARGQMLPLVHSWERIFAEIADPAARDIPVTARIEELLAGGEWTQADGDRLRRYMEGYMAADPERISARAVSEETRAAAAIEGANSSIREGYDALLLAAASRVTAAGAAWRMQTAATRIAWTRGRAVVATLGADRATKEDIDADRVVVTIPLPLLQRADGDDGSIRFEPEPVATLAAARRLAMGNVVKIFLRLRAPLAAMEGLGAALAIELSRPRFLQMPGAAVPAWWQTGNAASPVLVGWAAGPTADRLSGRSEEDVIHSAIAALAEGLGFGAAAMTGFVDNAMVADWGCEPWSFGAYSWIPAGALDAPSVLATPVEDTLYFAGEATDTAGYRGTVHGALESGVRAARQVLESMDAQV